MHSISKVSPSQLSYRAEIDGLRAIAVLSVVLYHAKMVLFGRDWLQGGYLGVDIFFVISGFLITRIILFELHETGRFSFRQFYERRARRILPALFLVILASLPFAWQRLLPASFVEFAQSILATLFFGSNFFFYFNTTEYGAESALLKPFLHTWSLGVEEQFYLFFPVLALIVYRYFRAHIFSVLAVLTLASLQFAQIMEAKNPDLNFYLPFSRFWELAVGSILALRELAPRGTPGEFWKKILPPVGLYLTLYAIFSFDNKTPHPSFYTILPTLGVALIIGFSSRDELIGRLLGSKPLVWLGLISYSAYLWHFPIFALSRSGSVEPGNPAKIKWIALTLALALVSYFAIERPFRNRKTISSRTLWSTVIFGSVSLMAFMAYVVHTKGVWDRYTSQQAELIKGFDRYEFEALDHPLGTKGLDLVRNEQSVNCSQRDPQDACRFGNEKVVFLGDSFVGHHERAIITALNDLGLGFISFNHAQCPFVSSEIWFGGRAECPYVNEQRRKIIESFPDKKIFIVSANTTQFDAPKKRTVDPLAAGRNGQMHGEKADVGLAWKSYFDNIRWLESRGHKVVLIRSVPQTTMNARKWLGENLQFLAKMDFPELLNESRPSAIRSADEKTYPAFNSGNILVLDTVNSLCDHERDRCLDVVKDIGPVYNGFNHLSYLGASLIARELRRAILNRGWNSL